MQKNNEIVIKADTSIVNENWYIALLEECQGIITEHGYVARTQLIKGYWELGKRIAEENDGMSREKVYGKKIVENLANDLGKSSATLFATIKFYKEYQGENFEAIESKLPEGKNITWSKIIQKYLGERQKEPQAKQNYKLTDILEVLKAFLINDMAIKDEKEIDTCITNFKELLIRSKN